LDINILIRKIKISINIQIRNWHAYSVEKHDHPVWWTKKIVFYRENQLKIKYMKNPNG